MGETNIGDRSTSVDSLAALRAGRLADTTILKLPNLGLTAWPEEIFDVAETLEVLDLGGNSLTHMPSDLGRLRRLRVLFASGNPFGRLPPVLGDCPALSQLGFRGCGLREIIAEALPPRLRWLTLTDNAIESLPEALGERPALQKLMLAGNRLRALPESLATAPNLELLRLSANCFEALPPWLADMPRLAWLAWSGNPLDAKRDMPAAPAYRWLGLRIGDLLGKGASGRIFGANWHGAEMNDVFAVKLFKGAMTSDGRPDSEMAACLAAGEHPNLAGGIGRVSDHPEGLDGLVMSRVDPTWTALAQPPSPSSCSRDVYDPALRLEPAVALRLAAGIASAGAHLHGAGLIHGDLYAHNIMWDGTAGHAVLGDFGAASFLPSSAGRELEKLDVLAFGILVGELLASCEEEPAILRRLYEACVAAAPASRPRMAEVAGTLM